MTRTLVLLAALAASQGLPAPPAPVPDPGPGQEASAAAAADPDQAPPTSDPAEVTFPGEAGMLLVPVKPDKTADYEAAIAALHEALHGSADPARRALAEGWVVFKAEEPDGKGNVLYVHVLRPVVAGADYRPSRLLDEALAAAPGELLGKYREAFAGPPTKLSLSVLADLATEPPPANVTPEGPETPVPPGNRTPAGNRTPRGPGSR
ncbi:MAG: hypothetical protein AB7H88_07245 [Vicinamibacterales bacterium]